jgi:WD40 repeat protein
LLNERIELWKDGNRQQTFTGQTDAVKAVKFSRKRIISASGDKTVRVWSIEQKSQLYCSEYHSEI